HNIIGDLHLKKNNADGAIESFRKAADIFNKTGFALKAIALYKKILNIKPDQVDVHLLMGKLNAERGLLGNANDCYLAAASFYSRSGQKNKAVDVYKTLCDLNPDNLSLAQKLAELYLSEGFEREGVSKYIELAEKKAMKDDLDGARENLELAAPKGSERFDHIRVSALVDFKSNRLPEATVKLEDARRVDPSDIRINTLLAEVYLRSGRYEESAALYSEMLEKDGNNIPLRKQLFEIYLKAGEFVSAWGLCQPLSHDLAEKNQFDEAEELLTLFLSGRPNSTEALQALSDIYTRDGKEAEAFPLQIKIADAYRAGGDDDKALNMLKKLQEKDPESAEIADRIKAIGQGPTRSEQFVASIPESPASQPSLQAAPSEPSIPSGAAEIPELPELMEELIEEPSKPSLTKLPVENAGAGPSFEESYAPPYQKTSQKEVPADGATSMDWPTEEAGAPSDGGLPDPEANVYNLDIPISSANYEPAAGKIQNAFYSAAEDIPDIVSDEKTFDITDDLANLDELEIFDTAGDAAPQETGGNAAVADGGKMFDLTDFEDSPDTGQFQSSAAVVNIEEKLDEIEIYIKYGLSQKAEDSLRKLSETFPDSELVALKYLDFFKVQGDIDGFTRVSVRLARICAANGRAEESKMALSKALRMDPGNEEVAAVMQELFPQEDNAASAPGGTRQASAPSTPSFSASAPEGVSETKPEPLTDSTPELPRANEPADSFNLEEAFSEFDFESPAAEEVSIPGVPSSAPQVEAPDPPLAAGSVNYNEEIAEADFYVQQGLADEAAKIYDKLLKIDPTDSEIRRKYNSLAVSGSGVELEAAGAGPEVPEADFEPLSLDDDEGPEISLNSESDHVFSVLGPADEPNADSDEFFDLAAELQDELDEPLVSNKTADVFDDKNLESVFQEFKKGVEEQLNKEDYETHYNLGIAYKEMGMLDEGLSEFLLASKDPARTLDCASMMGLCYIEKGEYAMAVEQFGLGLRIKGRAREEYMGLKYDLAIAYELNGDLLSALSVMNEIASEDPGFRDVRDRQKDLNKAVGESGLQPKPAAADPPKPETKGVKAPAKRNRVSYL
ncbi:MAG TPA: tetratricopeptide repeat protein, partial [Nitrospirota bacterium]